MKDNPVNIIRDDFENIEIAWEGDLWDRRRLGEQLERYVDRLNCGAVLALDARWGEGKTWFVRHWAKHLTDTEHNVVYLDAFANDYLDDPFLVITSEIANVLKNDKSTSRKINKLIRLSALVGTALLPSLPKVALTLGLHLVGAGLISTTLQQGYESAKDEIEKLSDEASERIKESIQEKIATHEAEKKTLIEFKKHLAGMVEKLDKPLVFIVDELDRCRPDFARRLIERIKHFFDIPKIVFILVMDKTQFSNVVCHNYGYDKNIGEEYLDKFIDFIVPFPKISSPVLGANFHHTKILKDLLSAIGEESEDICLIFYLAQFGQYYSPRQLKKKMHQYALLKTDSTKTNIFLVLALLLKPKKLEEKIIRTLSSLDSISKNQDMSGFVTDIKRLDLEVLEKLVQDKFELSPRIYFELIKEIQIIEVQNLGAEKTKNAFNELYESFALQKFEKNYYEFSEQFELYLNVHLQPNKFENSE